MCGRPPEAHKLTFINFAACLGFQKPWGCQTPGKLLYLGGEPHALWWVKRYRVSEEWHNTLPPSPTAAFLLIYFRLAVFITEATITNRDDSDGGKEKIVRRRRRRSLL